MEQPIRRLSIKSAPSPLMRRSTPSFAPLVEEPGQAGSKSIHPRQQTTLGGALIVCAVCIWLADARLLSRLGHEGELQGWHRPYFVGYVLKTPWVVAIPVWLLVTHRRPPPPGSLRLGWQTAFAALVCAVLIQACSITWVVSVELTTVSINSALYQTNVVFAYALAIPVLRESFSSAKTIAVALALAGALAIIFGKEDTAADGAAPAAPPAYLLAAGGGADSVAERASGKNAPAGCAWVLASSLTYAMKEVLYCRLLPDTRASPTPLTDACLVLGLVGLVAALCLPPRRSAAKSATKSAAAPAAGRAAGLNGTPPVRRARASRARCHRAAAALGTWSCCT